jgi:hypothetical protein
MRERMSATSAMTNHYRLPHRHLLSPPAEDLVSASREETILCLL